MLMTPIANHLVWFFFLEPVAALVAISIVVTVALVRRLNPYLAVIAIPFHESIQDYIIIAAMLAPVLVKICIDGVVSVTQGATASLRVNRDIALTTLLAKIRLNQSSPCPPRPLHLPLGQWLAPFLTFPSWRPFWEICFGKKFYCLPL